MNKLTFDELFTIEVALQSWQREEEKKLNDEVIRNDEELEKQGIEEYKESITEIMLKETIENIKKLRKKVKEMQNEIAYNNAEDTMTVHD